MLSPYIKPEAINGGMGVSAKLVANVLYGTNDALDKRSSDSSLWVKAIKVIDAAKDVSETIANALGIRSPYYVIGEIPKQPGTKTIWSSQERAGLGVIRAVATDRGLFTGGNQQEGVIIDCLGDINADISVEFTQRPIFYQSSTVIDSRIRKPVIIKATIAVSNHLSDDIKGQALTQAANFDATGALELAKNVLLYGGNTRAQYALYKLRWLMENGQPFTVYTPHGYYTNMLIQSIKPQTNEGTMDMLLCDIIYHEAIMTAPYGNKKELEQRSLQRSNVLSTDASETDAKGNKKFPWSKKALTWITG